PALLVRLRPAPGSALLPYAPLFRSALRRARPGRLGGRAAAGDDVRVGADPCAVPGARLARVRAEADPSARYGAGIGAHTNNVPRDRKSTRLNSSHRTISYAVFCLKK